jgi:hypothetical protein
MMNIFTFLIVEGLVEEFVRQIIRKFVEDCVERLMFCPSSLPPCHLKGYQRLETQEEKK